MKAYKFLRSGRVAPFSGHVWPEGGWVAGGPPIETCRAGVHACRPEQIAYWLSDELWEVELQGEIVESDLKVAAARGRLVRRVEAWDDEARGDFMVECVRRTATYAALELREHGIDAAAGELEAAEGLEDLAARATEAGEAAVQARAGAGDAATLAEYVVDAAGYAEAGDVAGTAFIPVHAAVMHAPSGVDDPFAAERAEQARWLGVRLGLGQGDA